MIGSPIDAIRFWEFAAVICSVLSAWLVPAAWLDFASRLISWFRLLAQKETLASCLVGLVAFCGGALVSWHQPPVPTSFDEFSYLLAADTFAHGRVTNVTPPMAEFYESPEVLLRPSYQSKYPPGQAIFLALGQRLTGSPLAGVWLSSALACAALCWMLQAWTTPAWAFYGSLLAALRFSFFGPWAQSYWGGMVAALGGALLYGALRRIVEKNRNQACNAICFALGIILLANTRPFEGLLAAVPAVTVLLMWFVRSGTNLVARAKLLAPAVALLLLAAGAMLHYDQRVTGNAWTLPYAEYEKQYDPVPSFVFQTLRAMPVVDNATMEAAAQDTLWTWRWQHGSGRLIFIANKLLEIWQSLFGVALGAVFVLLVWNEPYSLAVRILQTAVFLVIQSLAVVRFLFWPVPSTGWILVLLVALMIQAGLMLALFRKRWDRIAAGSVLLVTCGILLETWRFHPHYLGPIVALSIALVTNALRDGETRRFAVLLPVLIIGSAFADSSRPPGLLEQWARQRSEMQKQLESSPGKQLVFVYYRPGHDLYEEWVHNRADLQAEKVVWALSRNAEENCQLLTVFSGRKAWSLDADRRALKPYSTTCSSSGPDELVPNQ